MSQFDGARASSPLEDPGRWPQLLDQVGVDSILVVIQRKMGSRLRAHTLAEDIWGTVLEQAWRDRTQHQWVGVPRFRAWLLAIAKNRIKDEIDRLGAQKCMDAKAVKFSSLTPDEDGSISAILPSITATPARMAYYQERAQIMTDALASLPPEYETLVREYLFEQEPMEAIAKQLGIPLSTAWYRFRKGSELYAMKLKELLSISGIETRKPQ